MPASHDRALEVFRERGGMLRTAEARRSGIHPRVLYALRDEGHVEQVSRGVFRLASLPPLGDPDLVTVAFRVPRAVVCLVSALAYHDITTETPDEVHVALPPGTAAPRLDDPPLRVFRMSGPSLVEGIEVQEVDGQPVRIFSVEKTVADCFKFRSRIGVPAAVEALRLALRDRGADPDTILDYARICRVHRVMCPYLEALL